MDGRGTANIEGRIVSSPLELVVKDSSRLDIVCCLIDGERLTFPQINARTGLFQSTVLDGLRLLKDFKLIVEVDHLEDGEPLYAATLDDHPDWVREAIEEHHRS